MQKPASYQRLPHAQDCDCSVCWSRREMANPLPPGPHPAPNAAPSSGHGKRGGSRVIYYHFTAASQIALLLIYPKNEKADERKVLKQIIERWR